MKQFRSYSVVLSAVGLLMISAASSAHHSRTEFSGEVVELKGRIVSTVWANPHASVVVTVTNSDDSTAEWRIEVWGNLFATERLGVTADRFVEGAILRAAGLKSTRRDGYLLGQNLLFSDGTEAVLAARSSPRWTDQALQRTALDVEYQSMRDRVVAENRGIFRVWTPDTNTRQDNLPYTEEALATRAEWDELNNYLTRCEQPGMPVPMKTPQETEFIDDGDTIRVHSQYFDTIRTVHMNGPGNPDDLLSNHLGYSVGRWEGESLVIETTRINWPYFDIIGTPQGEAVYVVERYTPSDDQSRLRVQITITDPETFTEPGLVELDWLALGRTIQKYDCQVF